MGVKGKFVLVACESLISGHRQFWIRERTADKVERVFFDPVIRAKCLFREVKKVRGKESMGGRLLTAKFTAPPRIEDVGKF